MAGILANVPAKFLKACRSPLALAEGTLPHPMTTTAPARPAEAQARAIATMASTRLQSQSAAVPASRLLAQRLAASAVGVMSEHMSDATTASARLATECKYTSGCSEP
jgi:hypothetical protein